MSGITIFGAMLSIFTFISAIYFHFKYKDDTNNNKLHHS